MTAVENCIILVLSALYRNPEQKMFRLDVQKMYKNVLSEHETDLALNYLIGHGFIGFELHNDADDYFPRYKYWLTIEGIMFIEKTVAKANAEASSPHIPSATSNGKKIIVSKHPNFKKESIPDILLVLKDHVNEEYWPSLESIINGGDDVKEKILFNRYANALADFFKQLFEAHIITNRNKSNLQMWIVNNFLYVREGAITAFKYKYLEQCISGSLDPCVEPIIKIKSMKIIQIG
ncbi:MAG: hypothetical protein ACHQRM_14400 [Bacteroidia bacterium]